MRNKKYFLAIIGGIIIIFVAFIVIFINQSNKENDFLARNKNSDTGLKFEKTKSSQSSSTKSKDGFSNDEWMFMGYMSYAHDNYVQSRHIKTF